MMRPVQTENVRQVLLQVIDEITNAAHAKLAEVAEVLANLCGIEIELLRQLLGRNRLDPCARQFVQTAQVNAETVRGQL